MNGYIVYTVSAQVFAGHLRDVDLNNNGYHHFWIRLWDAEDAGCVIKLIFGVLPDYNSSWNGKKKMDVRGEIEQLIEDAGVKMEFEKWAPFDFWMHGTEENGYITVSLSSIIEEGGPVMADTVVYENYYISVNDRPLLIVTCGYTHQGCFLITNDNTVLDKVARYDLEKDLRAWAIKWKAGQGRLPWLTAGYYLH